jgi:hypothetical protein
MVPRHRFNELKPNSGWAEWNSTVSTQKAKAAGRYASTACAFAALT